MYNSLKKISILSLSIALSFASNNLLAEKTTDIKDISDNSKVSTLSNKVELPKLVGPQLSPEKRFRDAGQLIAYLMMQSHYQHPEFNNNVSAEAFKQLVKMLDPNRSYFLASDVASFKSYEKKFDDAIRTGRIELAYDFFELYEMRHRERYTYALTLLEKPFNFNSELEYEYDRRESEWFTDKNELNDYWQKKVLNDALNLKLADQDNAKIVSKLKKRYQTSIRRLSQTKSEDVFGFFMNSINAAIDPHTTYYTPRQFEDFTINMSLKLQGIGAVLTQEDEFTKIVKVVNKGPAQKSGQLSKDDKVIGVGQGDEGEIVDVIGWRNGDVVDLIRGEAGSVVRLQVIPHTGAGDGKTKVVRMVREEIKLEDQAAKSEVIQIEREGKKLNMGVIELPSFYTESANSANKNKELTSTTKDVKRLLGQLKKQNIDGVILDLRNNGGGSLGEVVDLTGLFIDKGPVVQGKDYEGNVRILRDRDGDTFYKGPLAVLVNGASASASEIFAAAIQDYGRGIVIGQNTFGKGTVQSIADLNRYMRDPEVKVGALKFTVEKFYRVTGESTQLQGVAPDISFPSFYDHEEFGESSYDNALAWDTIKTSKFKQRGNLESIIPYLKNQHKTRSKSDQEFVYLLEDINRVKQERDRKTVTLNYKERLAKRSDNDLFRLKRENFRRQLSGKKPFANIKALDEYNDSLSDEQSEKEQNDILLHETANILSDFIKISKNPEIANNFSSSKLTKNSVLN